MNFKYFHLNSECFLVLGENKATINNLLKREIIWLNEEQTKIAIQFENNEKVDSEDEFVKSLANADWGIFSENKFFVDKIRTKNLFSQNMFYRERPRVISATIHLTNECNLNCEFCGMVFCPSCLKYKDTSELPFNEIKSIINKLLPYNLQEVFLVGGEVALYSHLDEVLQYCQKKGIKTIVNTNGIKTIVGNDNNKFIINIFSYKQLEIVENNYKNYDNVIIVLYNIKKKDELINKTWTIIEKMTTQPIISVYSMRKMGVMEFYATKYYNLCLSNRIHIMNNLDVVTCLGNTEVIGNLKNNDISKIILYLYDNQWKDTKAFENNGTCGNCEFRYSCNPCIKIKGKASCGLNRRSSL